MMIQKAGLVLLLGVCLMLMYDRLQSSKQLQETRKQVTTLTGDLAIEREKAAQNKFKESSQAIPSENLTVVHQHVYINESRVEGYEAWNNTEMALREGKEIYSSAHCIGNSEKSKHDRDAWKKTTCRFKNLCYNPATERFIYFRRPGDTFDARSTVAMGPLNAQWNEGDKEKMRWLPDIVDTPLTAPHLAAPSNEVWIPHFEHCAANVMHLIMDSFYPWHNAVSLFGINKHIRPLRIVLQEGTLWGTCDYIRSEEAKGTAWAQGYSRRCTMNQARWVPAMLPKMNGREITDLDTTKEFMKNDASGKMVCFDDAVVGVGTLSDHCLKAHGWSWDQKDIGEHDCNQARGKMLWEFRKRMFAVSGVPLMLPERHQVLLFSFGMRGNPRWHAYATFLKTKLGTGVTVELAALKTAKQQLEQIQATTTIVAAMGGNTITAIFLPRSAGLVLLHDNKDRLDWDFWTHASHISVKWLPTSSPNITNMLGETVQQLLVSYEEFSPFPNRR